MINKETVDKIFEASRIEDVVGDFVPLKKRGANLLGVCPFHNEKTPSFTVSPAKGIYKCFGCGKGGHSVDFIMNHEQLSFPEALRYLAKKYHIEIDEEEATPEQQQAYNEREGLFLVSSFAQKHFTDNLINSEEGKSIGLTYFKERGFTEETINKFQLGYSFDKWRGLTDAAIEASYSTDQLIKAGLSISGNENKIFDRFAARIIFPVHNASGRVIAFGGRTLKNDKKVAKYINSPETEIYHKSNVLYGLFFSKKTIIAENNCFLVEGYTDVISLHQAGVENVVASSGTSLTVEQIRSIRRYTNNITILYDGDNAGIKASFRGINLILEEGMNVKVLLFPENEDPDSFSRKVSDSELKTFIKSNSRDFISFKTGLLVAETENDPIKKADLIRDIVDTIALIPDAISRSVYIKECSRILEVDERILISSLNKIRRNKFEKKSQEVEYDTALPIPSEIPVPESDETTAAYCEHQERDVIRILLNYSEKEVSVDGEDGEKVKITVAEYIRHLLEMDSIIFENLFYQEIYKEFTHHLDNAKILNDTYFINHEGSGVSKLAVDLVTSPHSLSINWLEKHSIDVITEDRQMLYAVDGAVNALKLKKVMQMIYENQKKIKNVESEEQLMELLNQQQLLLEAKKTISAEMGRVVVK